MPRELKLTNTLTRAKETFVPLCATSVGVYACGPTVYHFAHVGNLRAYVSWDLLSKTLRRFGYPVKYAMNITDVGHLSDDGDDGEDKMILAMRREGKSPWDIAKYYEEAFFKDCDAMNVARPDVVCRATEHIELMIKMIQNLEKNGYTYVAGSNVYFDTEKFPAYGELWGGNREVNEEFSRVDADPNKRNARDFVLWFGQSKFKDQAMQWDSPWGRGFPGWHIECSAMSTHYLGDQFDIHCGGVDHITGHHANEIAQSEGALGYHKDGECGCGCAQHKRWVKYWLHNEFILDQTGKMSKSKGEFLTLSVLKQKGYDPMAYRLFLLGGHYRSQLSFHYDAIKATQSAYDSLREKLQDLGEVSPATELGEPSLALRERFDAALADDLNTPAALAVMWEVVKDSAMDPAQKKALLADFDEVLSLGLTSVSKGELTAQQEELLAKRLQARADKDWAASDAIRDQLAAQGIIIKDSKEGQTWVRK